MIDPVVRGRLRALAAGLDRIDVAAYAEYGHDPLDPILGGGDPLARVCVFGRDPGRDEVRFREPFIGRGGQQVRRVLHQRVEGDDDMDFEASLHIGRVAFWANTVPYKPVGNKVWSVRARRAFRPVVADWLVHAWRGRDVICLGQVAFSWFGLAADRATRAALAEAWSAEPRFEGPPVPVTLTALDGTTAALRVWSLPHPSPLNATWYPRFPSLLSSRLDEIGVDSSTWRLAEAQARCLSP
jgi:uracil-DNA glycosylase